MRYLVLTDIHANLQALDAVLAAAPRRDFDRLLILGDVVGYGADPNPAVDRVRALKPDLVIRGNHDKVAAGVEPADGFNHAARYAAMWTLDHLRPDHREWLESLPRGPLVFEDVEGPLANRIAGPEHGFKLAMATFDRSRPWIAAGASGVIRRARDESVRYAMERKTFGEAIINHQMVSAMLADMEIAYQATRLLCLHAASEVDAGNLRGSHSACAKAFGGDAAMRATTDAVQVFGGYGYTQEFVVEKLMRDAKLLQIYEGTSQVQRMVIARDLVRQHT